MMSVKRLQQQAKEITRNLEEDEEYFQGLSDKLKQKIRKYAEMKYMDGYYNGRDDMLMEADTIFKKLY